MEKQSIDIMFIQNTINFLFGKNGLILFFCFAILCKVYCDDKICAVSSSDAESFLRCKVIIEYHQSITGKYISQNTEPSCEEYNESLVVTSTQFQYAQNIICTSNRPIFLQLHFRRGIPKEEYMEVHWGRDISIFNDKSTYTYELHITPSQTDIDDGEGFIKYEIFTYFPNMKIEILWIENERFTEGYISSTAFTHFWDNKVDLIANDEIVNIPCILTDPGLAKLNSSEDRVGETIDNSSVRYNALNGFYLNTSTYSNWEGTYGCMDKWLIPIRVNINRQPNVTWTTDFHHIYQNSSTLKTPFFSVTSETKNNTNIIVNNKDLLFVLTCTSKMGEVAFGIKYRAGYPNVSTYEGVYTDVVHTNKSKPEFTYTSKLVTSRDIIKDYLIQEIQDVRDNLLQIYCQDSVTKTVLHLWNLYYLDASTIPYVEVEKEGSALECHYRSTFSLINTFNFRQIKCNSRFSCKQMSPSVFIDSLQAATMYEASQCHPFHKTKYKNCKSLPVLTKGYFQCGIILENNDDAIGDLIYQDIYFQGFDKTIYIGNVEPPDSAVIKMQLLNKPENEQIWLPDSITLSCEAHSFYFERGMQWLFVYENGTQQLAPSKNVEDDSIAANIWDNVIRKSNIYLDDISLKEIICAAPTLSILDIFTNYTEWKNVSMKFNLAYAVSPKITSETSVVNYIRTGEKGHILRCEAFGYPMPEISWTYKGQEIQGDFKKVTEQLQFPAYKVSLAGDYVCTARNNGGSTSATFTVDTFVESSTMVMTVGNIVALVLVLFILVAIPIVVFVVRRLLVQVKDLLTDAEVKEFREGVASSGSEDKALSLPYNANYDLQESEFKMDNSKVLGQGAFGIVYSGSITKGTYSGNVAFKTIHQNCNREQLKSLLTELKIMMYLGEHENVVRLIGVYTKDIKNGGIYVATEFCSLGSLEKYLRDIHAKKYNNEENGGSCMELREQNNETLNHKFCTWSFQIANGMEYLAHKYIVHSDLAARNILLTSNEVVKITDFGLSRRMYDYYCYAKEKTKKDPLPWKWMAIESLRDLTFSTQSDIWAYGILLWEIFSLGAVPYPGISWTLEFMQMLEDGLRNPQPKLADSQIYSVMKSCWEKNRHDRPSFNSLKLFFMQLTDQQLNNQDTEAIGVDYAEL